MAFIYLLYCPQSGKGYVGQTIMTWGKRWTRHKNSAKSGSSLAIHCAIRKYGEDAFEMSVLQECSTIDELNTAEVFHIKQQNTLAPNGYNLTPGGHSYSGWKASPETKAKQRIAKLGKKRSPHKPETIEKIRAANKARTDAKGRFQIGHPFCGRR